MTGIFKYTATWRLAAHLAASGRVDLDLHVTGCFPLEEAESALNAGRAPNRLKSMVVVK